MINKLKAYLSNNGLEHSFDMVSLNDDGDGVLYIGVWNYDIPKPTMEELDSVDSTQFDAIEELKRLDSIVPRHIEEVLEGKPLYGNIKETVDRKKELRAKLAE